MPAKYKVQWQTSVLIVWVNQISRRIKAKTSHFSVKTFWLLCCVFHPKIHFTLKKTRKCISHQPELVLFVIHLLSQSLRERRSKTRSRGSSRLCQLVLVDVSRSFTTPGVRCIELIISFLSFLISILVAATSKNNKHDGNGNTQDNSYDCSCT